MNRTMTIEPTTVNTDAITNGTDEPMTTYATTTRTVSTDG